MPTDRKGKTEARDVRERVRHRIEPLAPPLNNSRGAQGHALPPTLAPRLIKREAAAAYISVSPNTFDLMVKSGAMPPPRLLGERRIAWDVRALDQAVDALPVKDGDRSDDVTWGDVDAA